MNNHMIIETLLEKIVELSEEIGAARRTRLAEQERYRQLKIRYDEIRKDATTVRSAKMAELVETINIEITKIKDVVGYDVEITQLLDMAAKNIIGVTQWKS